jgi:hypothetical protein
VSYTPDFVRYQREDEMLAATEEEEEGLSVGIAGSSVRAEQS